MKKVSTQSNHIHPILMKWRGKVTLNGTIAILAPALGALNKLKGKEVITTRKQICLKDTTFSWILSFEPFDIIQQCVWFSLYEVYFTIFKATCSQAKEL